MFYYKILVWLFGVVLSFIAGCVPLWKIQCSTDQKSVYKAISIKYWWVEKIRNLVFIWVVLNFSTIMDL